jgi:hypothetical protein
MDNPIEGIDIDTELDWSMAAESIVLAEIRLEQKA